VRRLAGARGIGAVVLVLSIGAAACSGPVRSAPAPSPQSLAFAEPHPATWMGAPFFPVTIARLMTPTQAVSAPGGARVVAQLETSVRAGGGPTELLVVQQRRLDGTDWLRVRLPDRPNQASGWIDANVAVLRTSPWRIVVSTERRTVRVFRDGQQVRSFRAVVGAPGSPTPHGSFAVLERIRTGTPGGFYGSWILSLTAHSTVYETFEGGDGRVAIHGRGGASLADPLGSARSHGCVRVDNSMIDWLAKVAGPGTPVQIV
jgi:lipoprotein-anchoring transpeptidase ErfK/SrfK